MVQRRQTHTVQSWNCSVETFHLRRNSRRLFLGSVLLHRYRERKWQGPRLEIGAPNSVPRSSALLRCCANTEAAPFSSLPCNNRKQSGRQNRFPALVRLALRIYVYRVTFLARNIRVTDVILQIQNLNIVASLASRARVFTEVNELKHGWGRLSELFGWLLPLRNLICQEHIHVVSEGNPSLAELRTYTVHYV